MSEWQETSLGKISNDISYGYTESANSEPVGPKFLRITDIASGRLQWDNVPYCPITTENLEKYLLKTGDIVIARTGATTGATYTIKTKDPKNVVFASYLIRYQIDKSLADPFFVDFVLRSYYWAGFVDGIKGGSAQPGANAKQFASFEFSLPPLPEQKAIAEVLSSLDDKIDLLHRQNKTLEQMAETLFRQWFVEEAGEDWEEGTLGDVIDFNPIYRIPKGGSAPYLEMKNVSTSTFNPEHWYYRDLTSGMKFQNGDSIIARITPCLENGKTSFIAFLEDGQIGWGSTEYIVMRMKEPFHKFISYLIAKDNDFRDFAISSMSGSSGRQRVQANTIKEYVFKTPTGEVIEKLNEQLEPIVEKLLYNAHQIPTLESLRDTLLPKLMSGEIRVAL